MQPDSQPDSNKETEALTDALQSFSLGLLNQSFGLTLRIE